ncbi:MAG: sugar phosphate isomerase/epimerase [Thermoprotei archaeon]|nr:MAG: sugar phosphate isomerase/epimerase [Thermoprotei archaeon]
MKKGINLWSLIGWKYTGDTPLEKIIEYVKETGYDGFEMICDLNLLHPDKLSKEDRKKIVEKARSLGLEISSLASGVFWRLNLGSADENLRKQGLEYLKKALELAHDIEAKVLLVVPAVASPDIPYDKMYELSKKSLKEGAKWAEDLGVVIGVENVWNKFLYSPLEFRRFIDEIGSDYVKAYLDIGNVLNLGYPEHWIDLLAGKIACVHVKDFDLNVGNITGFRHIGKGNMDWNKVIERLKKVGYDYYLVVECPPEFDPELKKAKYPEDGIKYAKLNSEALDKILGKR